MENFELRTELVTRYQAFRHKIAEMFSPATQQSVDRALAYADHHVGSLTRYDGNPMLDHDGC